MNLTPGTTSGFLVPVNTVKLVLLDSERSFTIRYVASVPPEPSGQKRGSNDENSLHEFTQMFCRAIYMLKAL
jgi:hypothetical protein